MKNLSFYFGFFLIAVSGIFWKLQKTPALALHTSLFENINLECLAFGVLFIVFSKKGQTIHILKKISLILVIAVTFHTFTSFFV